MNVNKYLEKIFDDNDNKKDINIYKYQKNKYNKIILKIK